MSLKNVIILRFYFDLFKKKWWLVVNNVNNTSVVNVQDENIRILEMFFLWDSSSNNLIFFIFVYLLERIYIECFQVRQQREEFFNCRKHVCVTEKNQGRIFDVSYWICRFVYVSEQRKRKTICIEIKLVSHQARLFWKIKKGGKRARLLKSFPAKRNKYNLFSRPSNVF